MSPYIFSQFSLKLNFAHTYIFIFQINFAKIFFNDTLLNFHANFKLPICIEIQRLFSNLTQFSFQFQKPLRDLKEFFEYFYTNFMIISKFCF